MVSVRYIVDDVRVAVDFYTTHLHFDVALDASPGFAAVDRDGVRLLLSAAAGPGGASQPMPDGRRPQPGGWNRIQLAVDDLAAEVDRLRAAHVPMRSEIVVGRGGRQVLIDDPAGNPVELFQAT